MSSYRFDPRWIGVIAVVVVLSSARSLPWYLTALALGGGGGYLVWIGWQRWTRSGGPPSRGRVTYWRGQRIDLAPQRRGPPLPRLRDIGPALIFLLLGGVMLLGAASLVLRAFGA